MSAVLLRPLSIEQLRVERRRVRALDPTVLQTTRDMLDDLSARGDVAALDYARRFGDLRDDGMFSFTRQELVAAVERLPAEDVALLERVAERVRLFASSQRSCLSDFVTKIPGGQAAHTCTPVARAGCYAPGGRYPLPSSVLMTAVTARVAGVDQVWVATPRPGDLMLAAAALAGADGVLGLGGVQAIGALAFGLCGAPPGGCDRIVGPGNKWVTAAKFLVSDRVGIDMLAGPSELLVVADETAEPDTIAADLLAQAEHDDDAVPMLVTTCRQQPARVEEALARQLNDLPTAAIARRALANGAVVVANSINDAIVAADIIASEHVEIMTRDAASVAASIRNAGAVFVGAGSAEVFGDYGAGPNHVLPTGGTARYRGGLSVFDFLRVRTWMSTEDPRVLRDDCARFARLEGLEAHARAAEKRAG